MNRERAVAIPFKERTWKTRADQIPPLAHQRDLWRYPKTLSSSKQEARSIIPEEVESRPVKERQATTNVLPQPTGFSPLDLRVE